MRNKHCSLRWAWHARSLPGFLQVEVNRRGRGRLHEDSMGWHFSEGGRERREVDELLLEQCAVCFIAKSKKQPKGTLNKKNIFRRLFARENVFVPFLEATHFSFRTKGDPPYIQNGGIDIYSNWRGSQISPSKNPWVCMCKETEWLWLCATVPAHRWRSSRKEGNLLLKIPASVHLRCTFFVLQGQSKKYFSQSIDTCWKQQII